jgi:Protein of unknown function (DUF3500)
MSDGAVRAGDRTPVSPATGLSRLVADMGQAVTEFLSLTSDQQRAATMLDFADEQERRRWFYTPTARPGLAFADMTPEQSQAVFRMLAVGLSEVGYHHVSMVIGLEHILDRRYGFPGRLYGGTPGTRIRSPGNYRVAVFGCPGDPAWSWRIGGHHVALQFTMCGDAVSVTPAFFGAEPARVTMPGHTVIRVLAAAEDSARILLNSLSSRQRALAVISPLPPTDMVQENSPRVVDGAVPTIGGEGPGGQVLRDYLELTPAHDEMYRYTTRPKGLAARDMSPGQRELMQAVIRTYFGHVAEPVRAQYEHVFADGAFDGTAFAWAGPAEPGGPHYYRIQGGRLLIEYDCAQNGANHTHSAWRDPDGDFGAGLAG